MQLPSAPVVVERERAAELVTVTLPPEMAAPLGSVTVTVSAPVPAVCAKRDDAEEHKINATSTTQPNRPATLVVIMNPPQGYQVTNIFVRGGIFVTGAHRRKEHPEHYGEFTAQNVPLHFMRVKAICL